MIFLSLSWPQKRPHRNPARKSGKTSLTFYGAIGIISKKGKYGGTYAHKDIAFEFGSAISVPFKLYLINEFQRLKEEEEQKQIGWSAKRELAKLNYHIHTDAIKHNLIPKELSAFQTSIIYANEADVMNIAKKINEATTTNPPNAMRLNKTRINHNYGLLIFLPGSFFLRLQFPLRFAD